METTPPGAQGNLAPPDQGVRAFLESSPPRVTAQDVERARQEKRAAHTKLMDDMEASVETQGQYFAKIGQKKPVTEVRQDTTSGFMGFGKKPVERKEVIGYEDDRAFILKAPINREHYGTSREEFVVVTKDGIFVAPFYHSQIDNPQNFDAKAKKVEYDTIVALTKGGQTAHETSKYVPKTEGYFGGDNLHIALPSSPESQRWPQSIRLEDFPSSSSPSEDFRSVVEASIGMTESPHKQNFESANAQAKVAAEASTFVKGLPPRE